MFILLLMLPKVPGITKSFPDTLDKLEHAVTDSIQISQQLDAALSSTYPQPSVVEFHLKKLQKSLDHVESALYK